MRLSQFIISAFVSALLSIFFLSWAMDQSPSPASAFSHQKGVRSGWFSIAINGSGPSYHNSIVELRTHQPMIPLSCLPTLRSGDHVAVVLKKERGGLKCAAKRTRMSGSSRLAFGLKLDLNNDDTKDLQSIAGIGEKMSLKIISKRPFQSVDSLREIKGIGERKVRHLSRYLRVDKAPILWREDSDR